MQILFYEKEGDESMTRKRIYLAFLLILGLLAFAGCANYDGVPDTNDQNNGIIDNNNGVPNNWNGMNGTGNGQNGTGNGFNNNTNNNGLNNNNNLNQ